MQQIITGEKKAILHSLVRSVTVPMYPELSVKNLYDALAEDVEVLKHLPNQGKRLNERAFLWSIANTLRPDFVQLVIRKAMTARAERFEED